MSGVARPPSNKIRLFVLLIVLAACVFVLLNRQYVIDTLTVWRYRPAAPVAAMVERTTMTERARFYFYASQPAIDNRSDFNTHCKKLVEKSAILGCYVNWRIYIYDITDTRLDGIKEVTAAHEMLHAAYDRLSESERQRINNLIEQQSRDITKPKLAERLKLYEQTEPGERLNELHSILGTEIASLSPELETYYRQYFANRAVVVALSDKYEAVFDELEQRQTALVRELNDLAQQIDSASASYLNALRTLQADIDNFNRDAKNGGFSSQSAFSAARAQLLVRQQALQSRYESIKAMTDSYTHKKAELDSLNTQAEGLQKSINSTALPEAPTL